MRISDFFAGAGAAGNTFNLTTGAVLSQNDLVEMGPDGRGYPATCLDYAAFVGPTTSPTTAALPITSLIGYQTAKMRLPKLAINPVDASIYALTSNSAGPSLGAAVLRYTCAGLLLGKVTLSTAASQMTASRLLQLGNGNFAAVFEFGQQLSYTIFDPDFKIIQAATPIEAVSSGAAWEAITLSGGGFAISYQQSANAALQRLAIYNNAGVAVVAPTTIQTWTGTTGLVHTSMVELSNGSIAIGCNSFYATTQGLYHGIWSSAGAPVQAFANLDTAVSGGGAAMIPEMSALAGYYAVTRPTATNQKGWVFNNVGALQGAPFSSATTPYPGNNGTKVVNDGSTFYLIWGQNDGTTQFTKMPVAGTGYSTMNVSVSFACPGNTFGIDAFCERGLVVAVISGGGTATLKYGVVTVAGQPYLNQLSLTATMSAGTPDARIAPAGDYCFAAFFQDPGASNQFIMVPKYAKSSILGVCAAATPQGAAAPIAQNIGSYPINNLPGSSPKLFDHTTGASMYGNKGVLLNAGVILKGM